MVESTGVQIQPGRQYIIRRPRLTRLLDESTARIILLIAPAGYGKTTLAREWVDLVERPGTWYRGGPASADVAALCVGLAQAAAELLPGAGNRMRERLRATKAPEKEVEPLVDLLAEDLAEWPDDAWLVFDDYHHAMDSEASERFVELLIESSPIRLLIASRRRPTWATARRLLYGELHEVGRNALAMSEAEALEVLARRSTADVSPVVALAKGWPAVIGLAALTDEPHMPAHEIPTALYDFFAEELYQKVPTDVRWDLCQLAVAPSLTRDLAHALFGNRSETILSEALRLGILTAGNEVSFEIHPLLRSFLEEKFLDYRNRADAALGTVGGFLISNACWDDCFLLAQRFDTADIFIALVEAALTQLLAEGRLATVARWLDHSRAAQIQAPVLTLAAAEVAFREGRYVKAEALANQAARELGPSNPLLSSAFARAGQAAHLNNDENSALRHYENARVHASTSRDAHKALWGLLLCAIDLEDDRALPLLDELERLPQDEPDLIVRQATGRFMVGNRTGIAIPDAIDALRSARHLLPHVEDPLLRSSSLNALAHALTLSGQYAEGLAVLAEELREAQENRLDFVLPYAHVLQAVAELGLRHFGRALNHLEIAEAASQDARDTYVAYNAASVRCRLLVARNRLGDAEDLLLVSPSVASNRGMYGEYLASRALVCACMGDLERALPLADQAQELTRCVDVQTLAMFVHAIASCMREDADANTVVSDAFLAAEMSGSLDRFVCAYRGYPGLLRKLSTRRVEPTRVANVLEQANDHRLAKQHGFAFPSIEQHAKDAKLSPREAEVYDLLLEGLSNAEIAQRLYISESTVKVHMRHIFDKFGVRSRTEAAVKGLLKRGEG